MSKIKEEKPISIEEYRSEAKRVDGVLEKASAAFARAKEENNLSEARQWCDTLSTSAAELRGLRARLSPRDLFIVQYNIEVINNHAISLVIPRGVSRKEVVHEAQEFVKEHHDMAAIEPISLEHWMIQKEFQQAGSTPLKIAIDGRVKGSLGDAAHQERLFRKKGLELPSLPDFVVAHAAFYAATGYDMIGRDLVRCRDGVLVLYSAGLAYSGPLSGYTQSEISAAAYIPEGKSSQR